MKELKGALYNMQFCLNLRHVESGEGIESQHIILVAADLVDVYVESGEGIESEADQDDRELITTSGIR